MFIWDIYIFSFFSSLNFLAIEYGLLPYKYSTTEYLTIFLVIILGSSFINFLLLEIVNPFDFLVLKHLANFTSNSGIFILSQSKNTFQGSC